METGENEEKVNATWKNYKENYTKPHSDLLVPRLRLKSSTTQR
jgi:hypothetical protein